MYLSKLKNFIEDFIGYPYEEYELEDARDSGKDAANGDAIEFLVFKYENLGLYLERIRPLIIALEEEGVEDLEYVSKIILDKINP